MAQTTPDASLDADIDLKKRARRRLVGAAALALLAAVVLPMVMDREPKPVSQEIQVRIPSQDSGGFASRILPGKPAATPLPPADNKPAAEPPSVAKAETPKAEAPKVEAPKAAEAPKPEPKAEAKPQAAPPQVAKPAPPPAKTDKPAEKPLATAKPAAKAEDARAAAALAGGEQWVVQLGAYKEAGNVKILLAKIKQMGLPSYTENFDSPAGARTRVRAGPFASREAAEKAKVRIKTIGIDGPVAPK